MTIAENKEEREANIKRFLTKENKLRVARDVVGGGMG